MKVLEYILGGNSFPIVVEENSQKHLVKLKTGMSGSNSLVNEWLGNLIGKKIGLVTRTPKWINLTCNLEYDHIYIEVRELIEKSMGINICFDYIESVEELSSIELKALDKKKFINVYLLDVLLLNIDRTESNLNLMKDKDGKIIISDFESSLFLNELINGRKTSKDVRILQCLKANPFYQKVENDVLTSFIKKVDSINFDTLLYDLPDEVLSKIAKENLKREFDKRKIQEWNLKELLMRIDDTILETEEAKKLRTRQNRDKLKILVSSIHNS